MPALPEARPPSLPHRATAFGLSWRSDIVLDGFASADAQSDAADLLSPVPVDVHRIDRLPDRGEGRPIDRGVVYPDGLRFVWEGEIAVDITDDAVAYCPPRDWTGTLPVRFYSTVAALTAAWRGLVPLHACAVEVDGHAVLIAGPSGAGKSSLTTGLLEQGAGFVADDLVVLRVADDRIDVARGRPAIRLHPDAAHSFDPATAVAVPGDVAGKWTVRPPRHRAGDRLALGTIVILAPGEGGIVCDAASAAAALLPHLFRRQRLAALPTHRGIVRDTIAIAARVPVLTCPPQSDTGAFARRARAETMAARIRDSIGT